MKTQKFIYNWFTRKAVHLEEEPVGKKTEFVIQSDDSFSEEDAKTILENKYPERFILSVRKLK